MLDMKNAGTKCRKYLFIMTSDTFHCFLGIINRTVNVDWSQVNKYVVVIIVIKKLRYSHTFVKYFIFKFLQA